MRWFRYRRSPEESKAIADAELAHKVAKQIEHHADAVAAEQQSILDANHLAPKIHRALGGH